MHFYNLYGHHIKSDVKIKLCNASAPLDSEDIKISEDNTLSESKNNISLKTSVFKKKGVATYSIKNGNCIRYKFHNQISDTFIKTLLYTAIPICLYQRGFLMLHASCLIINNRPVLFIGPKGSGKSTIASIFAKDKNMICEDRCLIDTSNHKIFTYPSNLNIIKLHQENNNLVKQNMKKLEIEPDFYQRECFSLSFKPPDQTKHHVEKVFFLKNRSFEKPIKMSFNEIFEHTFLNSVKPTTNSPSDFKLLIDRINKFCNNTDCFFLSFKISDKEHQNKIKLEAVLGEHT